MARKSVDQTDIDRAAALAEGKPAPNTPKDEAEPGEAELTSQAVTPEAEPDRPVEPKPEEQPVAAVEPEAPAPKKLHSKREEIVARAKAKRAEEAGEQPAAPDSPAWPPAVETSEQPKSEAPTDQPVSVTRKLKVDRVERELTQDEYDSAARMGLALGNRLTELNQLIPQVRALANQAQQRQTEGDGDSRASPPETRQQTARAPSRASALPDEVLDRIGEAVVYGDEEQRRQALRELAASAGPALTIEDVVEELQARNARTQELERAGQEFARRHGVVATDPGLQILTTQEMHRRAVDEMRAIGVEEKYLRQAQQNMDVALFWHGDFRRQGYQVSEADALADSAAEAIKKRYRLVDEEQPQPGTRPVPSALPQRTQQQDMRETRSERTAEKEQMRQPRRAAMVARTPGVPPARSRGEIVNEKRKQRGYTTV